MDFNLLHINNETILPIVLFGENRNKEVTLYHKKVMVDHFNIPFNYLTGPFPHVSHGSCMDQIISSTIDSIKPDYYWFCDHDAIILKKECIDIMYNFVKNKITIAGQIWQSNHKNGPNGMIPHPYVSQAFIWFPTKLYNELGRPTCDDKIERSDTAEEITYLAKQKGYFIAGCYPSSSIVKNTDLDNGCRYGLGNTYGPDLMYHVSQQGDPRSTELFVEKCKEVLNGKFI
jgi:hypothetical protein